MEGNIIKDLEGNFPLHYPLIPPIVPRIVPRICSADLVLRCSDSAVSGPSKETAKWRRSLVFAEWGRRLVIQVAERASRQENAGDYNAQGLSGKVGLQLQFLVP